MLTTTITAGLSMFDGSAILIIWSIISCLKLESDESQNSHRHPRHPALVAAQEPETQTQMNIPLLRKIQAKARKYPHSFQMEYWGKLVKKDSNHPCGAVGCIAGTAVLIADPKRFRSKASDFPSFLSDIAAEILGLDEAQQDRLFHIGRWPTNFWSEYKNARTHKARADVAIRRINHFIKTKGKE